MKPKETDTRNDRIFDIIVRCHIDTAEPVGSRTISRRYDVGLSPASIRNVMADLEEQGLLKQPHTSAGRIPTDRGYRYWVDRLMELEELGEKEKDWARGELKKARTFDGLAETVSKVISKLTQNAALLYVKRLKRVSFLNYLLEELVEAHKLNEFFGEEPELFIEGAFRIFEQPEFQDSRKMRLLLQVFDDKYNFVQILLKDLDEEGIHVHIGRENELEPLEDVSLVVKDCYWGNTPIGGVAVVGPTRMRYPKVVSVVDFMADSVTEAMSRF